MKIILILGGLLRKKRNGNYGSDRISYLRILAGYYVYKKLIEKNEVELIVSGGKGIYKSISRIPPVATVMKQELVKLGLDPKKIKVDKTDFTYPELLSLQKHISQKETEALIISNAYHLPRIRIMIDLLPTLKNLKNKVKLISAEKAIIKYNKKFVSKIRTFQNNHRMKKITASEKKGIKELQTGNYIFK